MITAYIQFNCGSNFLHSSSPVITIRAVNYEYRSRVKGRPAGSREARRIYFSLINFFSFCLSAIYTPANRPRDLVEMISVVRVSLSDKVPQLSCRINVISFFFSFHRRKKLYIFSQINFIFVLLKFLKKDLEFREKIFARRSLSPSAKPTRSADINI